MKLYNKVKVLEAFFMFPSKEFHIRSLARATNLHPNTVITAVNALVNDDLLVTKKDEETNRVVVSPTYSVLFKRKKTRFIVDKLFSSGLIAFLEEELSYPAIFLFGSCAKGEYVEYSDIDLFVVASEKTDVDISSFEKELCFEIQLFLHTKKDFEKLGESNGELVNNVLNGVRLSGFLEVW